MSKNVKRRKSLLFKYKDFTDEMIMNLLLIEIPKYKILIKSEMMAIKMLSEYNIVACRTELNKLKIQRIETLIEVARLRNIVIPFESYQPNITLGDVIQRIEEFKQEEISWITKHNYLFDLYDPNMKYKTNTSLDIVSSDEEISNVHNKYNSISHKLVLVNKYF